eukprot:1341338-Karenia_brevis.AAC.1
MCLKNLLHEGAEHESNHLARARQIAELPTRLGGIGLRSAARHAPAAYWAGWADALPMLLERRPPQALRIAAELQRGAA